MNEKGCFPNWSLPRFRLRIVAEYTWTYVRLKPARFLWVESYGVNTQTTWLVHCAEGPELTETEES